MTKTKSIPIFLCIFRNFLCISKNWWPGSQDALQILKLFLVAFHMYTQPWTNCQGENQTFKFFLTGYWVMSKYFYLTLKWTPCSCNMYTISHSFWHSKMNTLYFYFCWFEHPVGSHHTLKSTSCINYYALPCTCNMSKMDIICGNN